MSKQNGNQEGKDWVKILAATAALGALALGIFNTCWQYQQYQERLKEADVLISDVESIVLRGHDFDWQTTFNITLKVVTPHYLRMSISKDSTFYVDNSVNYMLVREYPTYVNVSECIEEHVEPGVHTTQLKVPVVAKFLIGGVYQAIYSSLTIGKLHFVVLVTDLQTNANRTLESDSIVRWN